MEWFANPTTLEDIGNAYFVAQYVENPQILSTLGIFEMLGLKGHNAYLDDVTPAHLQKKHEQLKTILQKLDTLDNPSDSHYYTFLMWIKDIVHEQTPFLFHHYYVNQMFGIIDELIKTFVDEHPLYDKEDIELYITRLKAVATQLHQTKELITYQQQLGIVPPVFTLQKTINFLELLMPEAVETHPLYAHLQKQCTKLKIPNCQFYLEQAVTILSNDIYKALHELKQTVEEILHTTTANDGVWALPDGDAYYQYCLKYYTTTLLSAHEVHELGLKEVQKVQEHILKDLQKLGISATQKDCASTLKKTLQQSQFKYDNSDAGREECLKDLEAILQRCRVELHPLFSVKPKRAVIIKSVPKEQEEGTPFAYYSSASMDGKRPGIFYINLGDINNFNKNQLESLTLHEAEPGHHFQIALQEEFDLPVNKKFESFTAFVEGWGLYCERLGYEHNFYSSIYSELGYLQWELLRSARLVVDTGIHYKKWSHQQAIDYMLETTGLEKPMIVTEVERYFVLPGQACSYKIGQLKIIELRERAQNYLKDTFSIQEFHDTLLTTGSVPLSLLEDVINNYIQEKTLPDKSKDIKNTDY